MNANTIVLPKMWECDTCMRTFNSMRAAEQHMNALGHWQHYCAPCQRRLDNGNSLRMVSLLFSHYTLPYPYEILADKKFSQHLNSRTHRGANSSCPFCERGFTSASGVSHHLETGSCPNARCINRESIFRTLRQRDRNGIIINNLLEWHGETWSTGNAWNGHTYQCYLCRRAFAAMGDLDRHLKSPMHKQEIYHCPNKVRCGSQFKILAAMFNHLESESCGFIKFNGVQSKVGGILAGDQMLIVFS